MYKIEPCPRCGCMPVTESYEDKTGVVEWFAICYRETCRMRGPIRETEVEALDAWNERAPVRDTE